LHIHARNHYSGRPKEHGYHVRCGSRQPGSPPVSAGSRHVVVHTPELGDHAPDLHDLPSSSILRILRRLHVRTRLSDRVPFSLALHPRPRERPRAVADPVSHLSGDGLSDLPRRAPGGPCRCQPSLDRRRTQSSAGDQRPTIQWRAQKVQHECPAMMRIAEGLTDEIVVGNTYDKYGTRNPLGRLLVRGFENSLSELIASASPKTIHEVGCGEGYWVIRWTRLGFVARGSDFSSKVIELARANAAAEGLYRVSFESRNVYDLQPGQDDADLLVCLEVLEQLTHPDHA